MASTERGRLLTEAHRQAQYAVRAASLKETLSVMRTLDPRRVDETFPEYRRRMRRVVLKGRALSAATSAAYYRAFREAEGATSALRGIPLAEALPVALETSLRVTGPVAVKQAASRGIVGEAALQVAMSATMGSVGRHVLDGGRDTLMGALRADPDAIGVARVTDGAPCAFCAMLAGRGAVYSKETANFRPHDRCGCQPEVMFERGAIPESSKPYADLWEQTSKGKSGAAARKAFADAHNAKRLPASKGTKPPAPKVEPVTKAEVMKARAEAQKWESAVAERRAEAENFRRLEREALAEGNESRARSHATNAAYYEKNLVPYEAKLAEARAALARLEKAPIREARWTRLPRKEAADSKGAQRAIDEAEAKIAALEAAHPEYAGMTAFEIVSAPGGKDFLKARSYLKADVAKARLDLERAADAVADDALAVNPLYGTDPLYGVNCQRVAQALELRRRGYAVTAPKKTTDMTISDIADGWIKPDGSTPVFASRTVRQIEKDVLAWPEGARGWIACTWKNSRGAGHIYNVERTADGVRYIDGQIATSKGADASSHLEKMRRSWLLRVDDLEPTDAVLDAVVEAPLA